MVRQEAKDPRRVALYLNNTAGRRQKRSQLVLVPREGDRRQKKLLRRRSKVGRVVGSRKAVLRVIVPIEGGQFSLVISSHVDFAVAEFRQLEIATKELHVLKIGNSIHGSLTISKLHHGIAALFPKNLEKKKDKKNNKKKQTKQRAQP